MDELDKSWGELADMGCDRCFYRRMLKCDSPCWNCTLNPTKRENKFKRHEWPDANSPRPAERRWG